MPHLLRTLSALVFPLVLFYGQVATAQSSEHPCRSITRACKDQGYSLGSYRSSGKGLVKDCLEKVVAGKTLAGVQVDFDTISSCKTKWKSREFISEAKQQRKDLASQRSSRLPASQSE